MAIGEGGDAALNSGLFFLCLQGGEISRLPLALGLDVNIYYAHLFTSPALQVDSLSLAPPGKSHNNGSQYNVMIRADDLMPQFKSKYYQFLPG